MDKIERMYTNLFNRLRNGIFAMDDRNEAFESQIAERVVRYSPKTLLNYPQKLADLVVDLGGVVGLNHDLERAREWIDFELSCKRERKAQWNV